MVIFENAYIRLDYNPATDIMAADMPDVDVMNLPEIQRLLTILVKHIRRYDVKRLLIDARKTQINVDESSYSDMMAGFIQDLQATRLQKLARIVSNSTIRESVVKKVYQEHQSPVKLQSFTDIPAATAWLQE